MMSFDLLAAARKGCDGEAAESNPGVLLFPYVITLPNIFVIEKPR
jgi:hypothetical protein